jgi:hypothetical protein
MTDESILVIRAKELRQIIREEMQAANRKEPEPELSDRMSRRQAAKFMDVSYQTMYNYTKAGIIKEHGTTGKKFYLKKELIEVIKNNS